MSENPFVVYGRHCASKITGCRYGEIFALHFYKEMHKKMEDEFKLLESNYRRKLVNHAGAWALFRRLGNLPYRKHSSLEKYLETGMFCLINDWTEDFDYPHDYDEWTKRKSQSGD